MLSDLLLVEPAGKKWPPPLLPVSLRAAYEVGSAQVICRRKRILLRVVVDSVGAVTFWPSIMDLLLFDCLCPAAGLVVM